MQKKHWYLANVEGETFLNIPFIEKESAVDFKFSDDWSAHTGESLDYISKKNGIQWKELKLEACNCL